MNPFCMIDGIAESFGFGGYPRSPESPVHRVDGAPDDVITVVEVGVRRNQGIIDQDQRLEPAGFAFDFQGERFR